MLNWLAIRAVASNHMAICYINTKRLPEREGRGGGGTEVGCVVEARDRHAKLEARTDCATHKRQTDRETERETDTHTHAHSSIVYVVGYIETRLMYE